MANAPATGSPSDQSSRLSVTRHSDTEPLPARRALLEALARARQQQHFVTAGSARWLAAAGCAVVLLWAFAGLDVAMYSALGSGVLLFALVQKGYVGALRPHGLPESSAIAQSIELQLLQGAVDGIAPWMKVCPTSPLDAPLVHGFGLVPHRMEYIDGARCLSGLYEGRVPFCAAHIDAGYFFEVRTDKPPRRRHTTTVFRGLVTLVDHPGTQGWVTLESNAAGRVAGMIDALQQRDDADIVQTGHAELERLFTVRTSSVDDARQVLTPDVIADIVAFRQMHPDLSPTIAIRDDTIAVAIPMADDPLVLRNNPARWDDELLHVTSTVGTIAALLNALQPGHPARLLEVGR